MRKSTKNTATAEIADQKAIDQAPAPTDSTPETVSKPSTPPGTEEKNGREAATDRAVAAKAAGSLLINGEAAGETVQNLVDKLLLEGSTFEDVVATVKECGGSAVTLNAVRSYFQGNPELQAQRVHYLVETSESLLAGLGDPDSAEARLAKAAMLTGFMNLHQDVTPVTPKDAEHARMERANLNLKHKLVVAQRDKARQAQKFTEERIRMLLLAQQKVKEQIALLQQDAKRQQSGEPLGPAMLQRIQQIYGLTCQPMLNGGRGDAAKA